MVRAAAEREEHEQGQNGSQPAQAPEGSDPKEHYTAILLARIDAHNHAGNEPPQFTGFCSKVKELP